MSHAAKAAMLIALSRGQLSALGQRRALTHLSRCDVCRNAQTGIRNSERLMREARTIETPAINYDAMTFALRQEARAQATRHSRRTLRNALAIAAAIALGALGATRFFTDVNVPTTSATATAPTNTTAHPTSHDAADHNDLGNDLANHTETTHAMATRAEFKLAAGVLVSADAGDVVLRPWDGTEMILARGSLARVVVFDAQPRPHRLHVELLRGTIDNRVAPLQRGDLYAIDVNQHVVRVVGTRFAVTRAPDSKAQVVLHEGQVEITRGGDAVANLRAPATWVEDTTRLDTGLKTAPTEHDAREADGTTPMERAIGKPNRTTKSANAAPGTVAPKAIQHLLARAAPLLRACHDQSKRNHPDQPTALQLELSVAASGQVEDVVVRAQAEHAEHQGELPEELVRCLRERALTWHLPLQIAGPAKVRVPLQFGPTR